MLLPDHHRRLDARCRALLASAQADDARDLPRRWRELEAELRAHMKEEEVLLLPGYAAFAPDDARSIADDHARISDLLTSLGAELPHRAPRVARLGQLVDALDAHARHEDAGLYPWAQASLPVPTEQAVFSRVCQWFGIPRHAPAT